MSEGNLVKFFPYGMPQPLNLNAALELASAGVPVFPCDPKTKEPRVKGGFKSATTDENQVRAWFSFKKSIGVPMGKITCLDIDAKHQPNLIEDFEAAINDAELTDLLESMPKQLTMNGGCHYFARVKGAPEPIKNLKFAKNADKDTTIETRGAGGYVITAPSKGYAFTRGGLLSVPTITAAQWEQLAAVAKSFDKTPEVEHKPSGSITGDSPGDSPGDQYNADGDMFTLLQRHGWRPNHDCSKWTRPGKPGGVSATWNTPETPNKFYVFSSNASPFESEQSYSPLAVYATLEHGGKFDEAARELAALGYGDSSLPKVSPEVESSIAEMLKNDKAKKSAISDAPMASSALDTLNGLDFATEAALIEREKEAKDMVFILPGIAARGQATVIYAEPNSGKTLLTLKIIHDRAQSGDLKDLQIYYCNFDDDFRGANQKARYVQHLENVKMIDNQKATPELILSIIRDSIEDGTASMICLVFDTLIRFVSDSDKKAQREFNKDVQKFIGAQGTIIALGHTNKHKSAEGKAVYGGTSDIRNCFSQSAFLELETEKDATDRRVKFVNDKLRGMSTVSTCYKYSHGDTKSWIERVETVERVAEAEANALFQKLTANQQRNKDQPIIDYMLSELKVGPKSHSSLERNNLDDQSTGSKAERVRVLSLYSNENEDPEMRLWGKSRGQNGGWNYYIEKTPPQEVQKKPWE